MSLVFKNLSLKSFITKCVCVIALTQISCGSLREVTYFNDVPQNYEFVAPIGVSEIKSNDLLGITVNSINPEASDMFNLSLESTFETTTASGQLTKLSGYLVDTKGYLKIPILGSIKAAGLTILELESYLEQELVKRQLLVEPSVSIRNLNFKVSVLGEVSNPQVISVPNEKISILEALARAGDITIDGNKQDVILMRELEKEGYGKFMVRLDLTSDDVLESPYYFLRSNDVVYVKPTKNKIASNRTAVRWIPVLLSSISLAIISITNL